MSKVNLTQAFVAKIQPPANGRAHIRDSKVPGLILTITTSGTKSFYLYRRVGGRPTRVLLGHHPLMSVELARDRAVRVYAEILEGANPNEAKREARRSGSGLTLGEVFDHFYANRTQARGSAKTGKTHKSRFETCLADWRGRSLASILRADVIARHVQLGKERGHVTANRAIQLLRVTFNYAAKTLGVEDVPNPAARIELFREEPRKRYLRGDELPKFFRALARETDETMRDFFAICLWTGARSGNVKSMRWIDVNLPECTWTIPAEAFKTRHAVTVALAPQAVAILKQRRRAIDGPWVFPGGGKEGHIVEPKTAWARLLKRAGLTDLKIHDLRHTLASWQAALGASLPIIGRSLGHTRAETTHRYSHIDIAPVRASVEAAAKAIAFAASKKEPSCRPK